MRSGSTLISELHRREHVVDRLREHFLSLLGQPVADREQGVAALGQIRPPELEGAACARLPSAAVHADERGERPGTRRQVEIAGERDAVVGGVADAVTGFDRHFLSLPSSCRGIGAPALFRLLSWRSLIQCHSAPRRRRPPE
jgi:hypothetical protein